MSLQSALINLVRKSYLSASVENDYTTGSPLLTRHDEIAFVDPHGDPCAIPSEPGIDSIDYEYAYATGARGHSLRGSLVKIALNIDYIDNTMKRRLDQWRQERALVWVQPNIGRNTLFSWRAVDMKAGYFSGGPAAKDLTGNYALTSVFGSYLRYWDTARRMFLPKSSSNRTPLVHTPGGAGLVAYPTVVNRMVPTYPKSATMSNAATASGWAIGGADAGDVSAALVTNGFGQADCPHSLRVSVSADTSSDRYLYVSDQFDPASGANYAGHTFVNGAGAAATVWLRGQLPDGAAILFGSGASDYVVRSLAGLRFDDWAPISVRHVPTAWATTPPDLLLVLSSATGLACSFEIGTTMVCQASSGYASLPSAPVWSPQVTGGTVSGTANVATTAAVTLPGQGTLMASFWAPAEIANLSSSGGAYELFGNTNLRARVFLSSTAESISVSSVSPATSLATASGARGSLFVAGKVNTVAMTWDGSAQRIYCNGELAAEKVTAATTVPFGASSSAFTIGRTSNGYCCAPFAMLTCRIDEGAMTATEVGQLHTALTDPIALALAKTASGRTFRITKTPQMLRASNGGSQILGTVELEQVDYDHFAAEPMSKEASIE